MFGRTLPRLVAPSLTDEQEEPMGGGERVRQSALVNVRAVAEEIDLLAIRKGIGSRR